MDQSVKNTQQGEAKEADKEGLKKSATGKVDPNNADAIVKEQEVNLKAAQEEIKKYKLKAGDYRVLVRILEANDLIPRAEEGINLNLWNNKDGSANPFVTVEILDEKKKTKPKTKTLNPIFNEQFYFEFDGLIMSQLEEASIVFKVMDYNGYVRPDTLIGTFEVDLTTIYFSLNHEIYQATLLLYDPEDPEGGTSGMLKVNVEVLGPDDEPNVHNVISEVKPGATTDMVLRPAKLKPVGHNIEINIFRAEHLPVLDFSTAGIDAFCVVKYAGVAKSTKVITSFSPEWNQNIKLACILPNQSKAVNIEVWDRDLLSANDLVGAFKVNFKDFKDKFVDAKWANLYGPPISATVNSIAEPMKLYGYDIGSHYKGRVLYSIGSYNERDPRTKITDLNFNFPDNPQPNSPQKAYVLRIGIYEAQEVPDREEGLIIICIGPYILKTKVQEYVNGRCRFYEQLPDKKMMLPVDPNQIPDIIFYFADEDSEERRHCFARLKAKDFLDKVDPPLTTVKLKEDKSLDLVTDEEFPGFIFAKISLFSTISPGEPPVLKLNNEELTPYQLRVNIFVARELPPADQEGTSDPYVIVRAAGQKKTTQIKHSTLNPAWYETLVFDVYLPDLEKSEVPEGISFLMYDSDTHGDPEGDKELLGRAWQKIEKKDRFFVTSEGQKHLVIYQKPRWKNLIYDATDEYQGKLLVSYALIERDIAADIPMKSLVPHQTPYNVHFFLIGVRSLNMDEMGFFKPKFLSVSFDVCGDEYEAASTDKLMIKNAGVNLNMYKELQIGVPHSQVLSPLLDVHLHGWSKTNSSKSEVLGYVSINLKEILTKYYQNKGKCESPALPKKDQNELNIEKLEKQVEGGNIGEIDIQIGGTKSALKKTLTKIEDKVDSVLLTKPSEESTRLLRGMSPIVPGSIKAPVYEEFESFRIGTMSIPEDSQVDRDYLEVGNVDLENKPDLTKGNVGELQPRGVIAKKGFLDRMQALFSKEIIEYEDYDTDPSENLDVIPAWIKDRETKPDELEDYIKESHDILTFDFKRGKSRGKAKLFEPQPKNELKTIASLKAIFLEGDDQDIQHKIGYYKNLLEPQKFVVRVYILEGVNITRPSNISDLPDTYVVVRLGNEEKKEIPRTLRKDTNRPEYFVRYDFVTELPGAPKLTVELWHNNPVLKDEFLGSTKIDLEARYFNREWGAFTIKPIEYRTLTNKEDKASYGRISMWVDLVPANVKLRYYEISPIEKVECELRVIVWEAKEFEFDDKFTDSNDLYIRGSIGENEWLETDTHWRARAKATYNWRWKFDMTLPIGRDDYKSEKFRVQLWDRDLITSNSMIGESEIDMNQHRMLDKVYKRREAVKLLKRYKTTKAKAAKTKQAQKEAQLAQADKQPEKQKTIAASPSSTTSPQKQKTIAGAAQAPAAEADEPAYIMTDQIWYDVYHPEKLDANGNKRSVGKVLLSFELMPKVLAEKRKNANGRDQPNNFPPLQEPVGRFSFDILSPLKMLKELLGPRLYRTICCMICCTIALIIGIAFGYYILTTVVGVKIAQ